MNAPIPPQTFVAQSGGSHYQGQWQHWDWVPLVPGMNWPESNATKYLARAWKKNGEADLSKASTYIKKLILQFKEGIIVPVHPADKRNTELRAELYRRWVASLDLDAPTLTADKVTRETLLHLGEWQSLSTSENLVEGHLNACLDSVNVLIQMRQPSTTEVTSTTTPADVVHVIASKEENRGYINQSLDPMPPQATPDFATVVAKRYEMAFAVMMNNQPPKFPVRVYSTVLEGLRRWTKEVPLDTNPRDQRMGATSDYAEALLKIDLGSRTLEESLPNKQASRTFAAVQALVDGLSSLELWLARMTEGDSPTVTDPVLRSQLRLQRTSVLSLLGQTALKGGNESAQALVDYNKV